MHSLREIMDAGSVAVIGASRDPQKSGAQLLRVLKEVGYKGRVAGVNPQGGEVFGFGLFPSLGKVPFPVDLAVLHIPPQAVPAALADCARKGVKGAVISSEGFAETGPEGAALQQEVKKILRSSGMRGFGPNTLGVVNTATGLTTSYYSTPAMLVPGPIGFAAQSGIFVGALLRYLSSLPGLGISKGIGMGNKTDVDECDALEYLAGDEQTAIIGLYLEDVRDGRKFLEKAKAAARKKPVLLIKGGRTAAGARASASHTASLAVQDAVFEGAIRQAGVIRVFSIDEFVRTLRGFLAMPLPTGGRLAFVTYSGAQAILAIDAAVEEGLEAARFGEKAKKSIERVIATPSKAGNPVDLFPDMLAHGFEKTSLEIVTALLDDAGVDGILFISFANFGAKAYRTIAEGLGGRPRKPVFFSLLGGRKEMEEAALSLEERGFPCFALPEMAVRVFSRMWRYKKYLLSR